MFGAIGRKGDRVFLVASSFQFCLQVRVRALFFFAIALGGSALQADSATRQQHALQLVDVDGHAHSTADGHITVLVVTDQAGSAKVRMVGDRVPDFCLGNPTYRMITLLEFDNHSAPVRSFLTAMVRNRLESEAERLQTRYAAHKIDKNARGDVFAVADFDGVVRTQLGAESSLFHVFVFGRNGELLKQWDDVPAAQDLAAALK
jgi:hypothetical protein